MVDPIYDWGYQIWGEPPNRQFRIIILILFLFFKTSSLSVITQKHLLEACNSFLLSHNQLRLIISFLLKFSDRTLLSFKL